MSIYRTRLWSSLFCLSLLTGLQSARAQDDPAADHKSHTEPQTVRVSFLQGDVRVMRGKKAEKETGNTWEQAQVNLPIEAAYSLVTGTGRAEIEFEDASTAYLGENSVLTFGKLTSKGGVTETSLQLIDGTLTLHFVPGTGDSISIASPTDNFSAKYPDHVLMRFNGFVDALGITPLRTQFMQQVGKALITIPVGQMALVRGGQITPPRMARMNNAAFATWDDWVIKRVTLREETLAQTMGQAGLDVPLAGLADLEGHGDFFDCAPYGRCWQPTAGWNDGHSGGPSAAVADVPAHSAQEVKSASQVQTVGGQMPNGQTVSVAALQGGAYPQSYPQGVGPGQYPGNLSYPDDYFPCGVDEFYPQWLNPYRTFYPWDWAVCHAGSWIRRGNRYAWVVQKHRHHHPPVRWVKVNGKPAYVPLHPRDTKDKPPINAKYGLYAVKTDGPGRSERPEHLAFEQAGSLKLLDDAPKSFRQPSFAALRAAEEPKVEARMARNAAMSSPYTHSPNAAMITFDHKSQSFVSTHQVMQDGHSVAMRESLGGGPSAAHSGSSGGSMAGGGTAHNSGGGSGGGGGSAGGSHGGGGGGGSSGGGGGASHGGGGSSGGGSSAGGGGGGSHPGH